jgi:hypothetical protein
MKKMLFLPILLLFSIVGFPQKSVPISLNLYGGYTFPDHLDLGYYNGYSNYGYLNGGGQFGGGLEFFLNPLRSIELSYQYMGTSCPFYDYLGQTNRGNDKATIQYILIGGNNYFETNGNLEPYAGIGIGVGISDFHYYGESSTSTTKFAWNLRLGVKVKTQSIISIKLQAYLQSIAQGVGVGVGFGTGGAGAGVTTYSTMLQFGLGGGLCFALGGKGNQGTQNQ